MFAPKLLKMQKGQAFGLTFFVLDNSAPPFSQLNGGDC